MVILELVELEAEIQIFNLIYALLMEPCTPFKLLRSSQNVTKSNEHIQFISFLFQYSSG